MKVLYLASRTDEATTLELEREITAIQRTAQTSSVDDVRFFFLPNVRLEQIGTELIRNRPDLLHISVHGNEVGLWFATEHGKDAELTASRLIDLLPPEHLPRLVLLNACESEKAAAELAARLPLVAIGSTVPLTNQAAITSGSIMYNRLLNGSTIGAAFRAMDATVSSLDRHDTALRIFSSNAELERQRLVRVPQIAAQLPKKFFGKSGVSASVGLVGCPSGTTQVCFFTDDPSFMQKGKDLEETQTEVIRDIPRGGEVWTETEWTASGDFRVGACGITGEGNTFASSAMMSDALVRYAALVDARKPYMKALSKAVRYLRDNLGDGLSDWQKDET